MQLYDATVRVFDQTLGAMAGLLAKAEAFIAERGMAEADLIAARLADDMLPFGYQVKSTAAHSIGAIEGVRHGSFSPDLTPWPDTLLGLAAAIGSARERLAQVTPEEVEGLAGRDMRFVMGDLDIPFTGEGFLLSFSLPNFHFHATMTYAILRQQGVSLGKRDYLGQLRLRR